MNMENFIRDALQLPDDYIAYYVGRELAELYPEKSIVEGKSWYFGLEEFARAKKCSIVHELSLFNQVRTDWSGSDKPLDRRIRNSWLNVLWKDQLLDVLLLTFGERCQATRHHWIVADTTKLAEQFFAEVCEWSAEVHGEVLIYQDGDWVKNKELLAAIRTATFENLTLRGSLKEEIRNDLVCFFGARETYDQYRIPWKRGLLFTGPPGNGKTHTVKALINQLKKPCLYVKSFKSEYVTAQEGITEVFRRARLAAPCLIVLEDLDSMLDKSTRSAFLNELDGFETNAGIVVIATTNYPERLDPAIADRPSRFDRKFQFDSPGEAERLEYIRAWNKDLIPQLRVCDSLTPQVVQSTEGFSFAYMKELFVSSMMNWMSKHATATGKTAMGLVMLQEARRLQEQMKKQDSDNGEPESRYAKLRAFIIKLGSRLGLNYLRRRTA